MAGFADVETLVCDYLRAGLGDGTPVQTKVPNPRPAAFVRAWRTGGPAQNRTVETPQVTVQAWAGTDVAALDLAGRSRTLLLAAASRAALPLVRRVQELGGLYFDPDPTSEMPRYTFTVQLTVRAPRG